MKNDFVYTEKLELLLALLFGMFILICTSELNFGTFMQWNWLSERKIFLKYYLRATLDKSRALLRSKGVTLHKKNMMTISRHRRRAGTFVHVICREIFVSFLRMELF
jgi:hypothetical protein